MPRVTVKGKSPKGLPNANTVSPGRNLLESPHGTLGRFCASIFMTARSFNLSTPMSFAVKTRRSFNVTRIWVAPSTTWSLVTMYPSGDKITPLPTPCSNCGCGFICWPPGPKKNCRNPGGRSCGLMPPKLKLWPPSSEFWSSCETREVTATLTTAGVTREATASTALSSATSDDTLLSSSGPAAATAAACALPKSNRNAAENRIVATMPAGTASFFALATNELVVMRIV